MSKFQPELITQFSVRDWLQENSIPYREHGENISEGWVGINCPFCTDDVKQHLGINLHSKYIACWRCGTKGTIVKLIRVFTKNYLDVLEKYRDREIPYIENSRILIPRKEIDPIELRDLSYAPMQVHRDYFAKRNFDLDKLTKEYKLMFGTTSGNWKYRVIIPIFLNRKIVSWTSRDVTDSQEPKAKHLANAASVIYPRDILFNIDSIWETVVVTEGPFDVFRIGKGSVATLGIGFRKSQLYWIKDVKQAFVLFDYDEKAQQQAMKLCNDLSLFVDHVENIKLSEGDPGDLSQDDIISLRRQIFGRVY